MSGEAIPRITRYPTPGPIGDAHQPIIVFYLAFFSQNFNLGLFYEYIKLKFVQIFNYDFLKIGSFEIIESKLLNFGQNAAGYN